MEVLLRTDTPPPKVYSPTATDAPFDFTEADNESPTPIPLVEVHHSVDSSLTTSLAHDQTSSVSTGRKWKINIQFITLCFCLFLVGWNDGTVGPLLPKIQGVYHVRALLRSLQEACLIWCCFASDRIHCSVRNLHIQCNCGLLLSLSLPLKIEVLCRVLSSRQSPMSI